MTLFGKPSVEEPYVPVAQFYSGKSIFITGATGFIGKALTEKLLYSCPDVGNIYLLVREKKDFLARDQFRTYFDTPLFDRLRKKIPENLGKIKFIKGDIAEANLGLSSENYNLLLQEVSVVFHLAATIKFNEPLSVAMKVNVDGTGEILKLCRNMKKIQLFVYVSTIFSNTTTERSVIEEKLYDLPKQLNDENIMPSGNDENDAVNPELLDGRPNTYTYSKALAEHLIASTRGDLPTIIIRPSIVTPAVEEPAKGWVASWLGPTPIVYLVSKGWHRCLYGDGQNTFDIIPLDFVVNLTVLAAARYTPCDHIPIYHSCSSYSNRLTLKQAVAHISKECRKQGFNDIPFPGVHFTTSHLLLTVLSFIVEVVPAYIADFCLLLVGKPRRFVNIQKKVFTIVSKTLYFGTKNFLMKAPRTQSLFNSMTEEDQRLFPCDPSSINWEQYMAIYIQGIRRYLLKEENYV